MLNSSKSGLYCIAPDLEIVFFIIKYHISYELVIIYIEISTYHNQFASISMFEFIIEILSFICLVWHITVINSKMLNHSFIFGLNPSLSWCIILFKYCLIQFVNILLRTSALMFIKLIGLRSFLVLSPCCYDTRIMLEL